jgi:hypothetical protein
VRPLAGPSPCVTSLSLTSGSHSSARGRGEPVDEGRFFQRAARRHATCSAAKHALPRHRRRVEWVLVVRGFRPHGRCHRDAGVRGATRGARRLRAPVGRARKRGSDGRRHSRALEPGQPCVHPQRGREPRAECPAAPGRRAGATTAAACAEMTRQRPFEGGDAAPERRSSVGVPFLHADRRPSCGRRVRGLVSARLGSGGCRPDWWRRHSEHVNRRTRRVPGVAHLALCSHPGHASRALSMSPVLFRPDDRVSAGTRVLPTTSCVPSSVTMSRLSSSTRVMTQPQTSSTSASTRPSSRGVDFTRRRAA